MLEISIELALVRDSDCCVYATNMHGFGGGGLGSNQTVAGLKFDDMEIPGQAPGVQIRPWRD